MDYHPEEDQITPKRELNGWRGPTTTRTSKTRLRCSVRLHSELWRSRFPKLPRNQSRFNSRIGPIVEDLKHAGKHSRSRLAFYLSRPQAAQRPAFQAHGRRTRRFRELPIRVSPSTCRDHGYGSQRRCYRERTQRHRSRWNQEPVRLGQRVLRLVSRQLECPLARDIYGCGNCINVIQTKGI